MFLMDLQERNERLFYKLMIDNVEELLPVVYTPTVGEACQKYGSIFRRSQGLYISLKDKGRVLEVLRNWPEKSIQVIVVTDGERILGLGDLGCQGMGIPVGKLALYTALGGVRPSACLPITIDVGTNNEELLNDEFYIGLRQKRATGQEYTELLDEFMVAVKQNYGQKVLVQFEDFANHNAFTLLEKYKATHLVFNDDIQSKTSQEEGLIVSSRKDSIQPFKKLYAHEHEPVKDLLSAIKRPIILALSNPTSKSECTAEQAYSWSQVGRAIFGSGSPFDPVKYNDKLFVPAQANNAYIFPGFGLGVVTSGAIRVKDDMVLAAAEALAEQVTAEHFDKGLIYPPFSSIRKISANIAARVAVKAYDLGLASHLPRPKDLVKYAESCMYSPIYRSYR
uniref:Malic enzyme n=1 Tax=Aegilops tauschii subsp. strangulata TaxID=200361 RepID=A0A453FF86_AEGTS